MPTKQQINDGLSLLEETLGRGKRMSAAAREVYYRALQDVDLVTWRRVVQRACQLNTWMPTPAELIELAGGGASDVVRVCWDEVERAMRRLGRYESVDFGPAVNATIHHLGGWVDLCSLDEEHLVFRRKEFEAKLTSYLRTGVRDDLGHHCVGVFEADRVKRTMLYADEPELVIHRLGPAASQALQLGSGEHEAVGGAA